MSRSSKQAIIGLGSLAAVLVAITVVASNANRSHGLRADVLSARRATPGESVTITVSVRDTQGGLQEVSLDFGDGSPVTGRVSSDVLCVAPLAESADFEHVYATEGVYTAVATVVTGGCDAKSERAEAIRTIQVKPLPAG